MDKKLLYQSVDKNQSLLTALSDKIWDFAELSMDEVKSAAEYVKILETQGFQIQTQIAGIPTAFSGSFGEGRPIIGILGEYDALSELSQKANCAVKSPNPAQNNGHGCGHNLLGAASLGAAIAIKEQIQAGNLTGTVIFYGCPGEEGCAGKSFMARAGLFRELDAALCWHPSDVNEVRTGSCAASLQYEYCFTGISAHAASDPGKGRSALDAAELMNIGVQFLREHMDPACSVHYAFTDTGGISPNVVQSNATLAYMIRGKDVRQAKKLLDRVNKIAQGAAMMTETTVSIRQIDGTSNLLSNTVMENILSDNLISAPLPQYSPSDLAFARAIKETVSCHGLPGQQSESNPLIKATVQQLSDNGTRPLNDFIIPYSPSCTYDRSSTDVGDVSWLTPTAQFNATTWISGSPGHSWQNVAIGKHAIAHKGMLYAAKVLAGAASDMMTSPKLLEKIRSEFLITSAEGYDCPLETATQIPSA